MSAKVFTGRFLEDSTAEILARISSRIDSGHTAIAREGFPCKQAQITSITYKVFDLGNSNTVTASGTLTVSSVIFDTLETPAVWYLDAHGCNFLHTLPVTAFPTGGNKYRIEYVITLAGGAVTHLAVEDIALPIFTS